jgi:hypothetical protein
VNYARQFFDMQSSIPDAQIGLCGDGLLQTMAREANAAALAA